MIQLWVDKLKNQKIDVQGPIKRFGDTEQVLTLHDQDGRRFRYQISTAKDDDRNNDEKDYHGSNIVDVLCLPYTQHAMIGVGTVQQVAGRTPTDEQQEVLR